MPNYRVLIYTIFLSFILIPFSIESAEAVVVGVTPTSSSSSTSTGVIPSPAPVPQIYKCNNIYGSYYKTGRFRCSQVRTAGSCNWGDAVVGLYSHYEDADFFCWWLCANIQSNCAWENAP